MRIKSSSVNVCARALGSISSEHSSSEDNNGFSVLRRVFRRCAKDCFTTVDRCGASASFAASMGFGFRATSADSTAGGGEKALAGTSEPRVN